MDWRIYAFCFIVLMFFITYFHVESVAKILGHLPHRRARRPHDLRVRRRRDRAAGPDGLVWQALNPASIFSGGEGVGGAARVLGVLGLAGVGFFACFWSWVGFEMAPNYAEEARNPKKMMAAAIYISCIGLGHPLHVLVVDADQRLRLDGRPVGMGGCDQLRIAPRDAPPISPGNGLPEGNYANVFYPAAKSSPGSASRTSSRC